VGVSSSGGRRSPRMRPGKDAERLRHGAARPNCLTAVYRFLQCEGRQFPRAFGRRGPTGAASLALYGTRLRYYLLAAFRRLHRETLHGYERRLSAIGDELKRIRECAGLPQHVMEEAEALLSTSTWWGVSRLKSPRWLCCGQRLRLQARLGLWRTS